MGPAGAGSSSQASAWKSTKPRSGNTMRPTAGTANSRHMPGRRPPRNKHLVLPPEESNRTEVMKITKIRATPLLCKFKQPYHWAQGVNSGAPVVLIEIETDQGTTGIGE